MNDKIAQSQHINVLMEKVHSIRLRYLGLGKQNAFNIFCILRKPHEEVSLHSAFLCELLNPKGSHGFTDGTFLQAFIHELQSIPPVLAGQKKNEDEEDQPTQSIDEWNEEKLSSTEVVSEWPFTNANSSGRIDILIKSHYQAIIIENKIYAEDQERQLERYYTYAKQKNKYIPENTSICYLTLFGSTPDKMTTGKVAIPITCVSYRENIQRWLDECIKLSAQHPTLRETLVQYKHLIKRLTGDTMEEQEKQEIFDTISNSEDSILSALNIYNSFPDLVADNIEILWNKIKINTIAICKEAGLSADIIFYQDPSKNELRKNAKKKIGKKNFGLLFKLFPVPSTDQKYYFCLFIQGHENAKNHRLPGERVTVDFIIIERGSKDSVNRHVNNDEQLAEFKKKIYKVFPDDMASCSDYYLVRRFIKAIISPAKHYKEEVALLVHDSHRNSVVETVMNAVRKLLEHAEPQLEALKAGG